MPGGAQLRPRRRTLPTHRRTSTFGWMFLVGFIAYVFLLYSEPHFYIVYRIDVFMHISFFVMLCGTWIFWRLDAKHPYAAVAIPFITALAGVSVQGNLGADGAWPRLRLAASQRSASVDSGLQQRRAPPRRLAWLWRCSATASRIRPSRPAREPMRRTFIPSRSCTRRSATPKARSILSRVAVLARSGMAGVPLPRPARVMARRADLRRHGGAGLGTECADPPTLFRRLFLERRLYSLPAGPADRRACAVAGIEGPDLGRGHPGCGGIEPAPFPRALSQFRRISGCSVRRQTQRNQTQGLGGSGGKIA